MTNSNALDDRQQRFLRYSSHMLLTPIMIIAGYAQGIEKGVVVLKDGVDVILDQCRRIASLTNKMLEFSQLMDEVASIRLEEISLGKHVSSYLGRYIFASGEKRISFSPDQYDNDLVLASGDLLDLILDNLISNAVRYARSRILVSICRSPRWITLSVADDGDGLSDQDFSQLFDLFYKGKDGLHGIGLAIAKQAAEAMGAAIEAANRPEGGAVFTLRLQRPDPTSP